MKIVIETDSDTYDCDACGCSYADGGVVWVDGKEIINIPAEASCFGGDSYSSDELLVLALHKLGHTITVDDCQYHITCYNDEYHGKIKE